MMRVKICSRNYLCVASIYLYSTFLCRSVIRMLGLDWWKSLFGSGILFLSVFEKCLEFIDRVRNGITLCDPEILDGNMYIFGISRFQLIERRRFRVMEDFVVFCGFWEISILMKYVYHRCMLINTVYDFDKTTRRS